MTSSSAPARIGALLDEAIEAVNKGDLATAHVLAKQVLEADASNADAEELIAAEGASDGELRRITILCCDLVGSTELSERHDPERYRALVRRYQRLTRETVEKRFGGHIVSVKGDGFLALFGHPVAHEDDTRRAVQAGLELCRATERLSRQAEVSGGDALDVRVGVHRGLAFIDIDEDDVYGLAPNLTSRVEGLARPGTVVVTDAVRHRVADHFQFEAGEPQLVKGVSQPVLPFTVLGERSAAGHLDTPFVGRTRELAVLRAAWDTTCNAEGSRATSVVIRGEPGIGKSRLASAIADHARDERAVVIELGGSQDHTAAGFHAIQVFLELRCGIHRDLDAASRLHRLELELGAAGADVDATVPLLAPILGLAPTAGYEPVAAEGRKLNDAISAAVYDYLIACNGSGPGVLLVDDVQWLDESTRALLSRVLAEGPGTLLVVLTSRGPVPLDAHIVIELEPLSPRERHELLDAMGRDDLTADARATLAERSDGVPLYLEELVRGWEQMSETEAVASTNDALPDALYEPLVARLLATNSGVTVAGVAAAVGRDVDRVVLHALLDLPADELDRELDALVSGRVLVPSERAGSYRFRHELLRTVAYELQPPAQRRRIHARAADLLVLGGESDEVVDWNLAGAHYEQADRANDAANAYAHAADRARRRGALDEARNHLGRAIDLVGTVPDSRERMTDEVALRLRRGFLAMSTEGASSAEAASDYERCLELAITDVQGDEMFSSLISVWVYYLSRADLERARHATELVRNALGGEREWFRHANYAGYGIIDWFAGDFARALDILETAATSIGSAGETAKLDAVWFVPNDMTASVHTHLALARFMGGDTAGADAEMQQSEATTAQLDFPQGPWSHAYGCWLRSWMLAERGDFETAAGLAADLVESGTRHGFDTWSMIGTTQRAAVEAMRALAAPEADSELLAARGAELGELADLWEAMELLVLLPFYLTVAGAALAAAGDHAGARARLEQAHALADRTGMSFYEAETLRHLAHLESEAASVRAALRAALDVARSQRARPFELRSALDLHAIEGDAATELVEAAVRSVATGATSADIEAARALIATHA